uniref:Immunoglobulin domain-containing protein n=1 Tax=Gopherus evgoodei TaxID=1825980 RepID=A0A8C4WNL8_9SAUR
RNFPPGQIGRGPGGFLLSSAAWGTGHFPSISVSPRAVIAPGAAVTLRCQCWCWDRRLFLYKDGIEIWELDPAGDEFTIPSARWEHAGAYSCRSHALWDPPNWSYASDIVWIIVAGEGPGLASLFPAPHPVRLLMSVCPDGTFRAGLCPEDAGSYSCYYRSKSDPPVWSYPSDPVELVVAGEWPSSTSPLPAPHPAEPSGGLALVGRSEPVLNSLPSSLENGILLREFCTKKLKILHKYLKIWQNVADFICQNNTI